ncbi:hypothetical protein BKA70DRAFT_1554733 [Coprinopsis sp. MPI-PUGE-AT-0042]|nr:hypothetical protein BKA70DRAFT_1554733 [Coprinopsis sp. MPI-PUGE-AT-0042]
MSSIPGVNSLAASGLGLDAAMTGAIAGGLNLIHILQVYTSSMVAVAVWDWMTCLRAEWYCIWKKEWSLIKGLYLWTRYYGIICFSLNLWLFNANFSQEECKSLHYVIAASCMWVTLGSETILAVRTYAFLGKKKWLGFVLGGLLAAETAFLLYVSIDGVGQIPPPPFPDADGVIRGPCTASDKPGQHVVSGFWLAPVAFDLICTFLTAAKALTLQRDVSRSPIVQIFVREGVFYFLAVAGVNVLNAAFMFQKNPNLQNINCFLALVLSQVLCCRLVLNLKGARDGLVHNSGGAQTSQQSYAAGPASRTGGHNIALKRYNPQTFNDHSDPYDGVKVQIDVEHEATVYDNESSSKSKM